MTTFLVPSMPPQQKSIFIDTGTPVGFETITVNATAQGLTIPTRANKALIMIEDGQLRWRDDGTNPTATVGMLVFQANMIVIESKASMTTFKAIRKTATNSKMSVAYYERV